MAPSVLLATNAKLRMARNNWRPSFIAPAAVVVGTDSVTDFSALNPFNLIKNA